MNTFILLQLLDLLTTWLVIRNGGREGNPFILWLIQPFDSMWLGFFFIKVVAVATAYILNKTYPQILKAVNLWFMVVVVWNTSTFLLTYT